MGRQKNSSLTNSGSPAEVQQSLLVANEVGRTVMLHSNVDEYSISNVVYQFLALANQGSQPINFIISTYGGSVDEMFTLYDFLNHIPCPIYTIALGKVMSAGVLLLASGAKGHRKVGRSARIMMHPISGGSWGNVFEQKNELKESERLQTLMTECLLKETKLNKKQLIDIMSQGYDYYLTPQQAIDYGICDTFLDRNISKK